MVLDYFWESTRYFEDLLREIFGDKFKIKYSLTGNGIYDLLYLDDGIYQIEYKEGKSHFPRKIVDRHEINEYPDCGSERFGGPTKQEILYKIGNALKTDEIYAKASEMSFPVSSWIAKIKIIKKIKEPV